MKEMRLSLKKKWFEMTKEELSESEKDKWMRLRKEIIDYERR